jgi:hypothetical protein
VSSRSGPTDQRGWSRENLVCLGVDGLNTSESSWANAPFPIRNTDTWPIWPYDGASGALSRSFDSDYSRSNDILHTSASGTQLWLLLPGGRYARELRLPPLVCDGKVFRFDLPGTHIADLNGDRLQDLAWIQPTRVDYFPNRGRGDFAAPVTLNLGRTLSAAEIDRADFSDVDGDLAFCGFEGIRKHRKRGRPPAARGFSCDPSQPGIARKMLQLQRRPLFPLSGAPLNPAKGQMAMAWWI